MYTYINICILDFGEIEPIGKFCEYCEYRKYRFALLLYKWEIFAILKLQRIFTNFEIGKVCSLKFVHARVCVANLQTF